MPKWDEIQKEWETTKITLKDLAEKHDIKLGTLKSRKSREGWSRDPTKKDATIQRDATQNPKRMQPFRGMQPKIRKGCNPNKSNLYKRIEGATRIQAISSRNGTGQQ